ncbi:MAG TPA: hypothetical protein VIS52_08035 [Motiliproteus sp.]
MNYQKLEVETQPNDNDADGGAILLHFRAERLLLKYQINVLDFAIGLFDSSTEELELLKFVELPHSSVIEDTRTFLG